MWLLIGSAGPVVDLRKEGEESQGSTFPLSINNNVKSVITVNKHNYI